jgi:hypothetical protein
MPFSPRGVKDYFQDMGFYFKIICLDSMAKIRFPGGCGQICQATVDSVRPDFSYSPESFAVGEVSI